MRKSHELKNVSLLEKTEKRSLYKASLVKENGLADIIADTGGLILDAQGGKEEWYYRLHFDDRNCASEFYERCTKNDLDLELEYVETPSRLSEMSFGHSLTEEQTEALRIAWNKGYFETPKRISLEQLSKEFEVTSQALSHRIRTAVEKILENTHLESNSAGEKL